MKEQVMENNLTFKDLIQSTGEIGVEWTRYAKEVDTLFLSTVQDLRPDLYEKACTIYAKKFNLEHVKSFFKQHNIVVTKLNRVMKDNTFYDYFNVNINGKQSEFKVKSKVQPQGGKKDDNEPST